MLFSGPRVDMSEPSHSLENGAAVYEQVSMNDVIATSAK